MKPILELTKQGRMWTSNARQLGAGEEALRLNEIFDQIDAQARASEGISTLFLEAGRISAEMKALPEGANNQGADKVREFEAVMVQLNNQVSGLGVAVYNKASTIALSISLVRAYWVGLAKLAHELASSYDGPGSGPKSPEHWLMQVLGRAYEPEMLELYTPSDAAIELHSVCASCHQDFVVGVATLGKPVTATPGSLCPDCQTPNPTAEGRDGEEVPDETG